MKAQLTRRHSSHSIISKNNPQPGGQETEKYTFAFRQGDDGACSDRSVLLLLAVSPAMFLVRDLILDSTIEGEDPYRFKGECNSVCHLKPYRMIN